MSEKYELPPVFGTTEVERSLLDPSLFSDRFKDLEQGGKCLAEYVWIGGTGMFDLLYVHSYAVAPTLVLALHSSVFVDPQGLTLCCACRSRFPL